MIKTDHDPLICRHTPGPWEYQPLNTNIIAGTIPVVPLGYGTSLGGGQLIASVWVERANRRQTPSCLSATDPEIKHGSQSFFHEGDMTTIKRPVLRYHGGKWRLAPWIISHFPSHGLYVEPYGGAASVLLRKHRSRAEVYNDINDTDPVERARRLVVRAFMGFGTGGARSAITGFRDKPWRPNTVLTGVSDWANYPDHLVLFAERLRGVLIENRPALEVISRQDGPDTLFYVDPPYVASTRSSLKNGYSPYSAEMTDPDHRDLAAALNEIEGVAVVSGYPSPYGVFVAASPDQKTKSLAVVRGGGDVTLNDAVRLRAEKRLLEVDNARMRRRIADLEAQLAKERAKPAWLDGGA